MSETRDREELSKKLKGGYLKYTGILLLTAGFIFLLITYFPLIKAYFNYWLSPASQEAEVKVVDEEDDEITQSSDIKKDTEVVFVDKDFGLYIPKIKANARVIANVDPYIEDEYINALRHGVAHASGTSFPNQSGNVFLFAHSAVNFYEQNKYKIGRAHV